LIPPFPKQALKVRLPQLEKSWPRMALSFVMGKQLIFLKAGVGVYPFVGLLDFLESYSEKSPTKGTLNNVKAMILVMQHTCTCSMCENTVLLQ
jgi:hypothetical protein